jgi:hypothetical protein
MKTFDEEVQRRSSTKTFNEDVQRRQTFDEDVWEEVFERNTEQFEELSNSILHRNERDLTMKVQVNCA